LAIPDTAARDKLWTKPYVLIVILNLTVAVLTFMLMATIPLYMQYIGGDRIMAGVTTAVFTFAGFLSRPWFGSLSDSKGRKSILQIGSLILLAVITCYSFFPYIFALVALRAIQGLGWSAVSTTTYTIAADLVPESRRFEGIGFFGASFSMAMAIGPATGLYIVENGNYSVLFILTALLMAVVFLIGFFLNYEQPAVTTPKNEDQKLFTWEKTALLPSLIHFLIGITYSAIVTFIPSYALWLGIKDIGLFFIIYALALLFSRPLSGKLADRIGPTKVIIPGLVSLLAALILLSQAVSLPLFLLAGVLYGLGFGSVQPVLNVLVINFAPLERRGAANGTFLAASDIGICIGAFGWGLVAQNFGFVYLYAWSPLLILISLLVYLIFLRPKVLQSSKKY